MKDFRDDKQYNDSVLKLKELLSETDKDIQMPKSLLGKNMLHLLSEDDLLVDTTKNEKLGFSKVINWVFSKKAIPVFAVAIAAVFAIVLTPKINMPENIEHAADTSTSGQEIAVDSDDADTRAALFMDNTEAADGTKAAERGTTDGAANDTEMAGGAAMDNNPAVDVKHESNESIPVQHGEDLSEYYDEEGNVKGSGNKVNNDKPIESSTDSSSREGRSGVIIIKDSSRGDSSTGGNATSSNNGSVTSSNDGSSSLGEPGGTQVPAASSIQPPAPDTSSSDGGQSSTQQIPAASSVKPDTPSSDGGQSSTQQIPAASSVKPDTPSSDGGQSSTQQIPAASNVKPDTSSKETSTDDFADKTISNDNFFSLPIEPKKESKGYYICEWKGYNLYWQTNQQMSTSVGIVIEIINQKGVLIASHPISEIYKINTYLTNSQDDLIIIGSGVSGTYLYRYNDIVNSALSGGVRKDIIGQYSNHVVSNNSVYLTTFLENVPPDYTCPVTQLEKSGEKGVICLLIWNLETNESEKHIFSGSNNEGVVLTSNSLTLGYNGQKGETYLVKYVFDGLKVALEK